MQTYRVSIIFSKWENRTHIYKTVTFAVIQYDKNYQCEPSQSYFREVLLQIVQHFNLQSPGFCQSSNNFVSMNVVLYDVEHDVVAVCDV